MLAGNMDKLNLSMPLWEIMTEEARSTSSAKVVSWSPFLFDENELDQFWNFTIDQTDGGVPTSGANPVCSLCSNPDWVLANPDFVMTHPFFGDFTCQSFYDLGQAGALGHCEQTLQFASACFCAPPVLKEDETIYTTRNTSQGIWRVGSDGFAVDDNSPAPWNPIWTSMAGDTSTTTFMYNQMSDPVRQRVLTSLVEDRSPAFSEVFRREGAYYENYGKGNIGELATLIVFPVFGPESDDVVIGSVVLEIDWRDFVPSNFPLDGDLVDIVVSNSCGQNYTFRVNANTNELDLIGEGDLHDTKFSEHVYGSAFEEYNSIVTSASKAGDAVDQLIDFCRYRFLIYPRQELRDEHVTNEPIILTILVCTIFVFTTLVFFLYDFFVRRRQRLVMDRATRTGEIVSSLFPENVRERLYNSPAKNQLIRIDDEDHLDTDSTVKSSSNFRSPKASIKSFLSANENGLLGSEPIADLFPDTTVVFIDISGFTAWSSERDPSQVFRLLESIYQTFDIIAKRRSIFKVETIGDSYVAATGLPEPRKDHAVVMVRFAYECLNEMRSLVKRLEVLLGPSTGDLKARCGMHSGPVTAGVLRGAKARFQLFGDTMNVAARLESAGTEGRIHISKETADILKAAGKSNWVTTRQELVSIKGKGEMQTFWASPRNRKRFPKGARNSGTQSDTGSDIESVALSNMSADSDAMLDATSNQKVQRLIDWNVQVMVSLLEQVVKKRHLVATQADPIEMISAAEQAITRNPDIVFDEITEVIPVPHFQSSSVSASETPGEIDPAIQNELTSFVCRLSGLYHDVPFHNFEHVSHVTMSAGKLMKRIVAPDSVDYNQDAIDIAHKVHDVTYGISSNPLMQFAIVFAAVIHDVDHTGLPNAELVRMQTPASVAYRGKSVAEQNSVDVAWNTLMLPEFAGLRRCIYTTVDELKHFRQLVVNIVMATDIADKELQALRRKRWAVAFDSGSPTSIPEHVATVTRNATGGFGGGNGSDSDGGDTSNMDRRATIVLEYIIQASDVAHTMQHWHTYQKWNERLFFERYKAYLDGHENEDPSIGWYKGEIGFFDFYIIPLAKKLKECGVFGVSHHEYLRYAEGNRMEWEKKGQDIVKKMHAAAVTKFGMGGSK